MVGGEKCERVGSGGELGEERVLGGEEGERVEGEVRRQMVGVEGKETMGGEEKEGVEGVEGS